MFLKDNFTPEKTDGQFILRWIKNYVRFTFYSLQNRLDFVNQIRLIFLTALAMYMFIFEANKPF